MSDALFHQDWWLDAVAPGRWRRVEVRKGDRLVATLPYVIRRRYGVTALTMPPMTQFLGPWIAPAELGSKYSSYLGQQKEWMTSLIEQLPPHHYFAQKFHPEIGNWLPFYWKGFDATVKYTYILEDLRDVDGIKSGFQENIRRDIKKAESQLKVRIAEDTRELLEVNRRAFVRLGRDYPHGEQLIARVFSACRTKDAGRILLAEDVEGRIHAALFYVWGQRCAHYLIGGGDPELRNSGATSLLMWRAIQHAAEQNLSFDFEGSMLEPVERFVRAFGGRQTPYLYVTRKKGFIHVADALGLLPGSRRIIE